jgi:2,3-diketo-5-methylthio-1-phosphopentane phosphatase/HAD superfamily hydrolase (TIGR01509 family)
MKHVELYQRGELGSAGVYQAIESMMRITQRDMDAFVLEYSELDPGFPDFLRWTGERGIDVKVISDGFDATIKTLFRNHGISGLEIFANSLTYDSNGMVKLVSPHVDPDCGHCGVCKVKIIKDMRKRYDRIVLIGDGESDRHAAEEADAVLAIKDLFLYCAEAGLPAVHLNSFSEAPGLLIRRVEAVMYDMDGTLVDSAPLLTKAFNHMFRTLGYPTMTEEEVMRKTSLSLVDFVKQHLRPEDGVPGVHLFRDYYSKIYLDETRPMPHAASILETLSQKCSQGIITNKKGEFARNLSEKLGFSKYLTKVIGAQDGYKTKPSGEMLQAFLEFVAANKESGVYVGDSPIDIEAAQSAGMDCFALAGNHYSPTELAQLWPRRILRSLEDLPAAIEPVL